MISRTMYVCVCATFVLQLNYSAMHVVLIGLTNTVNKQRQQQLPCRVGTSHTHAHTVSYLRRATTKA